MLKNKANLEELHHLPNRYHAKLLHLLKLILRVDGFQVEPIGDVALDEVVIVLDSVDEDYAFLAQVLFEVVYDCTREGESGVAFTDVVD